MEANINDFDFNNYFSHLLDPVHEENGDITNAARSTLHYLGSSTGTSNLFFSISKQSLYNNEPILIHPIKKENKEIEANDEMDERQVTFKGEESTSESPLREDVKIDSPEPIKQGDKPLKRKNAFNNENITKDKKRAKMSKATSALGDKKRINYCFDIHRVYCPNTQKERYYCNVSIQGKLQETVDLIKGKRGKYAYTFFDQRKNRKERRYWPSQSCGPVLEDNCACEECNFEKMPQNVSFSQDNQEQQHQQQPTQHHFQEQPVLEVEAVCESPFDTLVLDKFFLDN